MQNPWALLPGKEPFVLKDDKPVIDRFNSRAGKDKKIHLEVPPSPYSGSPKSRVVVLSLNPGFDPRDYESYVQNRAYMNAHRKMLLHKAQEYPFIHFNPRFSESPGFDYYRKKLGWLIDKYGLKTISNEILWIQYFPYPSKEYGPLNQVLESQKYSFNLVHLAMERHATIVVMRNEKGWLRVVPELVKYKFYKLNSPRAGSLSPGNSPLAIKAIQKLLG